VKPQLQFIIIIIITILGYGTSIEQTHSTVYNHTQVSVTPVGTLLAGHTEGNRFGEFNFLLLIARAWLPNESHIITVDISVRGRRGFPDITTATDTYLYWKTGYKYWAAHLVYWIWKRHSAT
jgi:hypothetical protein